MEFWQMAILINDETVLTLTEAAKMLPRRRGGKRPHVSTLYRWGSRGLRGIVLETIQIGGTTCTSFEALQRFFSHLSEPRNAVPNICKQTRQRNVQEAIDLLSEEGF
jgi:hypothetical protein